MCHSFSISESFAVTAEAAGSSTASIFISSAGTTEREKSWLCLFLSDARQSSWSSCFIVGPQQSGDVGHSGHAWPAKVGHKWNA